MRTLIFGQIIVYKWRKYISVDPNFWSNGRRQKKKQMKEDHVIWPNGLVQIKEINQWGPSFLIKWLCKNKKIKSMRTIILGHMVVYKWKKKKKKKNQYGPLILVEWSCTEERIMKEDHVISSNSRVRIKEINQWGPRP